MTATGTVGFVGFGEAASCFVSALAQAGVSDILVFCNGAANHPPYTGEFLGRVKAAGARAVDTLPELVRSSQVVFSAVVVAEAETVGRQIARHLDPGKLLIDINATTPGRKRAVADAAAQAGAEFVDANLMGAVSIYGATVRLYVSGSGAERFRLAFAPLGFNVEVADDQAGTAALVKMLRSVVTKGMEALIVEAMSAAYRAGIAEQAFRGIVGPMDATTYTDFATMCIKTDAVHAGRRAVEMEGAVDGLSEMGVLPIMTSATVQRLRASAELGVRERFAKRPPATYLEVLEAYQASSESRTGQARQALSGT